MDGLPRHDEQTGAGRRRPRSVRRPRLRAAFASALAAYRRRSRVLEWAVVPLLALLAYATVLRIGFLSDDFVTMIGGRNRGFEPPHLAARPQLDVLSPD